METHHTWPGISGSTLKMIAVSTMLIDHAGATVIRAIQEQPSVLSDPARRSFWGQAYSLSRDIGRVAFPIFCFLIVEGFLHTRNVKKYAERLFLFALASELPFDLALKGNWYYPQKQNVYFTLLIGLLSIAGISWLGGFPRSGTAPRGADCLPGRDDARGGTTLRDADSLPGRDDADARGGTTLRDADSLPGRDDDDARGGTTLRDADSLPGRDDDDARGRDGDSPGKFPSWLRYLWPLVLGAGMWLAAWIDTDYNYKGVFLIAVLYLLRQHRPLQCLGGAMAVSWEMPAPVAFVPILLYNGKRGLPMKYFFYWFYPVHLLLLHVAAQYLVPLLFA